MQEKLLVKALMGLYKLSFCFLALMAAFTLVKAIPEGAKRSLITAMTSEKGFFENASALLLLLLGVYNFWLMKKFSEKQKRMKTLIMAIGMLSLLGHLEEISWGQHIFKNATPSFLLRLNNQGETNLHNIVPSFLFDGLIYQINYYFFIYAPLAGNIFSHFSFCPKTIKKLLPYAPSTTVIFIFCFSTLFQIYHSPHFQGLEKFDLYMAYFGMLLLLIHIALSEKGRRRHHFIHYFLMLFVALILYLQNGIFGISGFEIREFYIILGFFLYWQERVAFWPASKGSKEVCPISHN